MIAEKTAIAIFIMGVGLFFGVLFVLYHTDFKNEE